MMEPPRVGTSWDTHHPDPRESPDRRARAYTSTATSIPTFTPSLLLLASHAPDALCMNPFEMPTDESAASTAIPMTSSPPSISPPPLPSAPIPSRAPSPENFQSSLRRVKTVPPPVPPQHGASDAERPPSLPPKPSKSMWDETDYEHHLDAPSTRPSGSQPRTSTPPPPLPPPLSPTSPLLAHDDADDAAELAELAAAMALSQAETAMREQMLSQEEADIARAIEESMAMTSGAPPSHTYWHPTPKLNSFTPDSRSGQETAISTAGPSSSAPITPQAGVVYMDDAAFARMLAEEDGSENAAGMGAAMNPDDRELARQIALEEEADLRSQPVESSALEPPDSIPPPVVGRSQSDSILDAPALSPVSPTDSVRPASASNFGRQSFVSIGSEDSDSRLAGTNHYIDAELLLGVSLAFGPPSITPVLVPMSGSIPNIISLPYGRCPPLHLQAPNWRHLMRLMARLSGTRIEPNVEAFTTSRSAQLHLRTVVQFVRPHLTTQDWRTVLWFTIDHPVPASMPGAKRFTTNDPDVLPWSYTLSTLPALLRDSSDTTLSKTYTVPATSSVPYPALPVSFPDLMIYLQAALEESRRYLNDSSSSMRKLARMVELCAGGEPKVEEEKSRMRFLRKVIPGRKEKKGNRGGNEETYELVTPFVLDDYGP